MLKTLSDPILSLVCPQECTICRGPVESLDDGVACSGCWDAARTFDGSETLCSKCGAFLFAGTAARTNASCRKCEAHNFDRAVAVGIYESALSASVLRLKSVPQIPARLRRLVQAAIIRSSLDASDVLIPVPLSPRRLRERGFNQAVTISKVISKFTGIPIDENSLIRKVHTPMHRAGMDRKARAMTVKNAFQVVRPKLVENRSVVLVDDILTSGETASICAEALKASGASTVTVFTIARAA